MAAHIGHEKAGGRVKGTPNKANAEIKDMIRGALDDAGGRAYLTQQALDNPVAFMGLLGKILPKDVSNTIKGELTIESITRTIIDPKGDNAN